MRSAGAPPHKAKQRRLTAVCAAAALLLQTQAPSNAITAVTISVSFGPFGHPFFE